MSKTGQRVGELALRVERVNDFEFKISFDSLREGRDVAVKVEPQA